MFSFLYTRTVSFCLFIFLISSLSATDYFVATTGADLSDQDGLSEATAWASLAYACDQMPEGEHTLNIGTGNFICYTTAFPKAGISIIGNGKENTILSANADWPVSSSPRDNLAEDYLISFTQKDDVRISGIGFNSASENQINGALKVVNCDRFQLVDCAFEEFRWSAAFFIISNECLVENCDFLNAAQENDGEWSGMLRSNFFNFSDIRNCTFASTYAGGVGYKGGGHEDTELYDCTFDMNGSFAIESPFENEFGFQIHHNTMQKTISVPKGLSADPADRGYDYTIWIHHNTSASSYAIEGPRSHMRVSHNYFNINSTNGRVITMFGGDSEGPMWIHNNVAVNVDRAFVWKNNGIINNVDIYNNTIYLANAENRAGNIVGMAGYTADRGAYNWTFKNNIVVCDPTQSRNLVGDNAQQVENLEVANNLCFNFTNPPHGLNNIVGELPDLRASGEDFNQYYAPFCGNSNVVDAGADVGAPFVGASPDIGALEYDFDTAIQGPFENTINIIPGFVEAELFDKGGQGIAYDDDNSRTGDAGFRPGEFVDVQAQTSASGGFAVGDIVASEFLEYTVEIEEGLYDISLQYATSVQLSGGVEIFVGEEVVANFSNLPATGGDDIYVTTTLNDVVLEGKNCAELRLFFNGLLSLNLDGVQFVRTANVPVSGIEIQNCPEVDMIVGLTYTFEGNVLPALAANQNLSWSSADDSILSVSPAGVCTAVATGSAEVIATSEEGSFSASCTVFVNPSGQTNFGLVPLNIPGRIQIEDYDEGGEEVAWHEEDTQENRNCDGRDTRVDFQESSDTDGTCNLGWIETGEWIEYTVQVAEDGYYQIDALMASNNNSGRIGVEMDGESIGTIDTPGASNGWQDWAAGTIPFAFISAGEHVMRVNMLQGSFNLNYIDFTLTDYDPGNIGSVTNISVNGELKKWHPVVLEMEGPQTLEFAPVNPFTDYRLNVDFTSPTGNIYTVPGYFAADGNAAETSADAGNIWRVKFAPDEIGTWNYAISFRNGPQIAVSLDPIAGEPLEVEFPAGSFDILPTDKTGNDNRAKGRLDYVGERYLQYQENGEWFIKGGADSPENLLGYADFDNTYKHNSPSTPMKTYDSHLQDWNDGDPTWQGEKGKSIIGAVNYLSEKGMNVFSFLPMNVTGDGKDVWPWVDHNDPFVFDVSKLAQWEILFDHADKLGMFLHFKTQETENDQLLDGGNVGLERKLYYRELIARFGHHLALNWNLGEENTQTDQQRIDMAAYFAALDPYRHHVVIHTYPGQQNLVYTPLLGNNSELTGASVQIGINAVHDEIIEWLDKSENAGKKWVVASDEIGPAQIGVSADAGYPDSGSASFNQDNVRHQTLWGTLMAGGVGVEYYFGYSTGQTDLTCQDFRSRDNMWDKTAHALGFFRDYLNYWEMEEADNLVSGNEAFCLAHVGNSYAIYIPAGESTSLDLSGLAGDFEVKWFDPRNGGALQDGSVLEIAAGASNISLGNAPSSPNEDWAVLIRNVELLGCPGDLNNDSEISVLDLLNLVAELGCSNNCSADLNGDGLTTVSDLLTIISLLGTTCE